MCQYINLIHNYYSLFQSVVLSIIISCDLVTAEGKRIIPLCYQLRDLPRIYDMEKEELMILANMAKQNYPVLTAGGLFEINRKTMLTFITTVTTYLIILTQLGNEDFTHKFKY